jgi:hypothetical protein
VYTLKYNLSRHQNSESCQKFQKIINNCNFKIKETETQCNNKIKILELQIQELTKENEILKSENKSLEKSNESFIKIVEKAATKSSKIVNNNNNTYNRNNYLNYVSSEPIKFGEIQQKINNLVTTKTIMYDNDNFNNYITKNILKDENGKNKVLCTDINRKNFTYKDETSGQMISDPELERLREKLKNTSNNTSVKKDLLDKLISKYEGTGIDPYVRFYECLQNIEYGQPFVEHVAKKTYVKGHSLSIDETNDKNKELEKIDTSNKIVEIEEENFDKKQNDINKKYENVDIDNINLDEIEDIEILDWIIDKYEKKLK